MTVVERGLISLSSEIFNIDGVGEKGVNICQRSVSNVLDRYEELISVSLTDRNRIKKLLGSQKQVILAIDGLQPQVGHEVLWVKSRLYKRINTISQKSVIESRRRS